MKQKITIKDVKSPTDAMIAHYRTKWADLQTGEIYSYGDMIDAAEKEHPFFAAVLLLANYTDYVGRVGHLGYFECGLCNKILGYTKDFSLHKKMISFFEKYFQMFEYYHDLLTLMKNFEVEFKDDKPELGFITNTDYLKSLDRAFSIMQGLDVTLDDFVTKMVKKLDLKRDQLWICHCSTR
jgi:hypothetical protein